MLIVFYFKKGGDKGRRTRWIDDVDICSPPQWKNKTNELMNYYFWFNFRKKSKSKEPAGENADSFCD